MGFTWLTVWMALLQRHVTNEQLWCLNLALQCH
ncbi:hypothetical protein FHR25_003900 [Yokenella regensburgei]|nr:hypothetical protein FHR25_003900 [Yokenella regensburgei]